MSRILFQYKTGCCLALLLFTLILPLFSGISYAAGTGVVSQIVIEPPDAIPLDELKSLVDMKEGAPYSRRALKKGVKLLYLKGGFSDIIVEAEEDNGKVRLVFRFTMKERVGKISFSGNHEIKRGRLEEIPTLTEGDEFNIKEVEKQAASIKEFYLKNGYFQCSVDYTIKKLDNRVDIKFIIAEGRRASISKIGFTGNTVFSREDLLKRISISEGKPYDEDRVFAQVKKLEDFYKRNDYLRARVASKPEFVSETQGVDIVFNIDEGEREKEIRVGKITFKGNSAMSSKKLRKQMLTGRVFSEETFSTDIEAIEFLYKKSGFLAARITEKNMSYDKDGTRVNIELTIHEGPKTIIRNIMIEGNALFTADKLISKSGLKTGTPLDPWVLNDSVVKMASLYFEKGYIYARVSYNEEFTEDRSGVTIKYKIIEGFQVKIGKIIIRGNDFTEDKVIRRELIVKPGDIYNPELVFKSQQRVYRLGYLSNVRLTPVDEELAQEEKDLVLSVKERKAGAFEFGAGYGTEERFRGFGELSHKNIKGTGIGARLRGDISEIESSFLLGFKKPWLLDLPVDGRFSLVDQVTERESYSLEKYAAIAGLDKDITEFIKGSLQYEYEINRLFDVDEGAIISEEDEGTLDIGTISPIIIRDSRDNPFNPAKGSVNSFKLDYSSGIATDSQVKFLRYIFQSSWYFPVYKRVVWGLSARGGWADTLGDTDEIPISKRFFLGGRTTVRGFELDSIGPKGSDGSATGGDAYLNLNSEFRFPIYRNFGGLVFTDAGNVWLKNNESVNIMDLRSSAGVGFRYLTPIGPLSFDVGWKLDRKRDESDWEWHFTIGNVF